MQAVIYHVEADAVDGGYVATAVGHGITTQAETIPKLKRMIADAVRCHFDVSTVVTLRTARDGIAAFVGVCGCGD